MLYVELIAKVEELLAIKKWDSLKKKLEII